MAAIFKAWPIVSVTVFKYVGISPCLQQTIFFFSDEVNREHCVDMSSWISVMNVEVEAIKGD